MPFDLSQIGTTAGSLFGGPAGALLGGLAGGLLGGGPQLPPELARLYRFQLGIAKQEQRFANSVPLSDPSELAALSSQRGLLGQEQNQQSQNLMGQYSLNNAAPGQTADFLTNLSNSQLGQRQSLDATHLLAALQSRRQALLQASQVGGQATSAAAGNYIPQTNYGALFGALAKSNAYNRAQNPGPGQIPEGTSAQDAIAGGTASPFDPNPGGGVPPAYDPYAALNNPQGSQFVLPGQ